MNHLTTLQRVAQRSNQTRPTLRHGERGVVIIEAMIGILIFSIGILAIVGLQAFAVRTTSDTALRTIATAHAERLVASMRTQATGADPSGFATGGAQYTTWFNGVSTGARSLPGATANVTVTPFYGDAGESAATTPLAYTVDVAISWVQPGKTDNSGKSTYRLSTSVEL